MFIYPIDLTLFKVLNIKFICRKLALRYLWKVLNYRMPFKNTLLNKNTDLTALMILYLKFLSVKQF